jgi:hypothetical protein
MYHKSSLHVSALLVNGGITLLSGMFRLYQAVVEACYETVAAEVGSFS